MTSDPPGCPLTPPTTMSSPCFIAAALLQYRAVGKLPTTSQVSVWGSCLKMSPEGLLEFFFIPPRITRFWLTTQEVAKVIGGVSKSSRHGDDATRGVGLVKARLKNRFDFVSVGVPTRDGELGGVVGVAGVGGVAALVWVAGGGVAVLVGVAGVLDMASELDVAGKVGVVGMVGVPGVLGVVAPGCCSAPMASPRNPSCSLFGGDEGSPNNSLPLHTSTLDMASPFELYPPTKYSSSPHTEKWEELSGIGRSATHLHSLSLVSITSTVPTLTLFFTEPPATMRVWPSMVAMA